MVSGTVANCNRQMHTLKHVLDQHTALSDLLIHNKLFIVGCDEENHFVSILGGREGVG